MTTEELRELAEAATDVWETDYSVGGPVDQFVDAFTATVALALLDEIDRLRGDAEAYQNTIDGMAHLHAAELARQREVIETWHREYGKLEATFDTTPTPALRAIYAELQENDRRALQPKDTDQ